MHQDVRPTNHPSHETDATPGIDDPDEFFFHWKSQSQLSCLRMTSSGLKSQHMRDASLAV